MSVPVPNTVRSVFCLRLGDNVCRAQGGAYVGVCRQFVLDVRQDDDQYRFVRFGRLFCLFSLFLFLVRRCLFRSGVRSGLSVCLYVLFRGRLYVFGRRTGLSTVGQVSYRSRFRSRVYRCLYGLFRCTVRVTVTVGSGLRL